MSDLHHIPLSFEDALSRVFRETSSATFTKIVHGDCIEKLKEIEPHSVHLVITDPPYFLDGLDADWKKGTENKPMSSSAPNRLAGMRFDPKQGKELQKFMGEVAEMLLPAMVPGAFAVIFSQPRLVHRMAVGLEDAGFEIRDLLAWHFTRRSQFKAFSMDHFIDRIEDKTVAEKKILKRRFRDRKTPQLRPQFEAMVLAQKPKEGTFVNNWIKYETGLMDSTVSLISGYSPSNLMKVEKPRESNGHLTVKPVLLIEHLVRLFSVTGQVVLDPFLGSGTTAVAAKNARRTCIGIEIEKDYIATAERRLKEE